MPISAFREGEHVHMHLNQLSRISIEFNWNLLPLYPVCIVSFINLNYSGTKQTAVICKKLPVAYCVVTSILPHLVDCQRFYSSALIIPVL